MSKKPPCFQDPEIFEEDHPDCIDCDFYGACRVLVRRKMKVKTKEKRTRTRSGGKKNSLSKSSGGYIESYKQAPTVDYPGMGFVDKLLWNTIRQTGSTVFGEVHRAWDESVPRVRYTSILKHLESKNPGAQNDSAEENSSEEE